MNRNRDLNIKEYFDDKISVIKNFCSEHKKDLAFATLMGSTIILTSVTIKNNVKLSEENKHLLTRCDGLIKHNKLLTDENRFLRVLCREKDLKIKKISSEALRLGSSFGGQEMSKMRKPVSLA